MMKKRFLPLLLTGVLGVCELAASGGSGYSVEGSELGKIASLPLVIASTHRGNPAKCGESVTFSVTPVKPPSGAAAIRIFKFVNAVESAREEHPISKFSVTMSSDVPAHLMVTGVYVDSGGKVLFPPPRTAGYGDGVLVSPENLRRSRKRPLDFDAFWDREVAKLADHPVNVKRRLYRTGKLWRCDEVELSVSGAVPVTGFLVVPENAPPKTLPAVIYFHGAGFKSSSVRSEFNDRAIVFDVNAHGIRNGMDKAFYRKLNQSPPAGRDIFSGLESREENYFKNMFLRTVRAVEFVKSLPEWNGRTLIVAGRSQGGAQAIAAAALAKEVTLCIANVPALGDHGGAEAGRLPGWPLINPQKNPAIARTADYIDIINLASRIKCETIMSIGLIDSICPPVSVWLAYMELKCKKNMKFFPQMGHNAPPAELDGRQRIKQEIVK